MVSFVSDLVWYFDCNWKLVPFRQATYFIKYNLILITIIINSITNACLKFFIISIKIKIFNKYFSAAKKFRKIGTGLGLYLALQIAKSHGGELTVECEEGEYTEFTIKLPAVVNTNLHYGE